MANGSSAAPQRRELRAGCKRRPAAGSGPARCRRVPATGWHRRVARTAHPATTPVQPTDASPPATSPASARPGRGRAPAAAAPRRRRPSASSCRAPAGSAARPAPGRATPAVAVAVARRQTADRRPQTADLRDRLRFVFQALNCPGQNCSASAFINMRALAITCLASAPPWSSHLRACQIFRKPRARAPMAARAKRSTTV